MSEQTMLIGQELVRRKLASLAQIRECMSAQADLERHGRKVPLGHLLVARGVVGLEDLKEVLSALDQLRLYCTSCRSEVAVRAYDRHNAYMCNKCSSELVFTSSRPADEESEPVPRVMPKKAPGEDPLLGSVVGGCKIRRKIASGGMGTVYEAEQVNLGRTVALKVLADDLADDEVFVKRFMVEARAAAELNHVNIIHINDAGQEEKVFFYTMEYVEGENLNQILRREKKIELRTALEITRQTAEALAHAHKKDIIHRDIKPENIMITPEGQVKLADLGLAKKVIGETQTSITQAGSILGTPYYMAPEQAKDFAAADARSDLYSLGVTLYKMLVGNVPFQGASPIEVMMKALDGRKTSVHELVDVPLEVSQLVDKAMHLDPEKRYPDALQLRDALVLSMRKLDAELAGGR